MTPLNINIHSDLTEAKVLMHSFKKIIAPAARRAINRALVTMRKEGVKLLKSRLAIKSATLKTDFVKLENAKMSKLEGSTNFSGNPIPLRRFVQGYKGITSQKGKKYSERRVIKVQIVPGKIVALKTAFIQRAKSIQVFNRTQSGGFVKRSTNSVGSIVGNPRFKIAGAVRDAGAAQFKKVFAAELKYRTGL